MIKIHCSKTLENLINIENIISEEEEYSDLNIWSSQTFKIGKINSIIFMNHKNTFYFVISDINKINISQLDKLFIDGLVAELKKTCSLDLTQESRIRSNFKKINYFTKSENKNINFLLRNYSIILRSSDILQDDYNFEKYLDSNEDTGMKDDINLLFIN